MAESASDRSRPASPGGVARRDRRLTRDRRLDPAGYRRVFDGGASVAGRGIVVWHRASGGLDGDARVGVVASKRSFHDAVDRNRARRRMREVFRLFRANLLPGADLVLVARPRIRAMDFAALAEDFRRACRKAGLWIKGNEGA